MENKFAPHAAKVVLYRKGTGERFERWPVDAREMVASGEYTVDPPSGETPATPVAPASSSAAPVAIAVVSDATPIVDPAAVSDAAHATQERAVAAGQLGNVVPVTEHPLGVPIVAQESTIAARRRNPVEIPAAPAPSPGKRK